jgi:hypothetical protein
MVGILFALLFTMAAGIGAQTPVAQASGLRFLGRWKFNAAKSDVKSSQLTFTQTASGDIAMTVQGLSQTFRIDGKERPAVLGSTAIWTQSGARSWRTVYRMANVDNNIDQFTLAEDGNSLRMKTEFLIPKRSEQTLTFTRVSGGPGLMGVWKTETIQNDGNEFEMRSQDGRVVTIHWLSWGGTAVAPVDGTEVPVTGPPTAVAPGQLVSLKVTRPNAFDLVQKMNGAVISTAHYIVSPDGRTLTVDVISGSVGATQDRVKLVFEKR